MFFYVSMTSISNWQGFCRFVREQNTMNMSTKEKEIQEELKEESTQNDTSENQEQEIEAELSEVELLTKERNEIKDQHLRLFADFENFKKRTSKERIELFSSANQELMSAMLPVLDDFQRALNNMESEEEKEGISLIYNKVLSTLKSKGLKPMASTKGETFNSDTMEAITRIPAPSDDLKGKVIEEIEAGYELGSKIIRYARVVVGE